MDINMPIMNGFDATQKIRQWEQQNNIKASLIIACTAESIFDEEEISKYKKCGFNSISINNIVLKPISRSEFDKQIKSFIQLIT